MTAAGKTPVSWNFTTMPSEEWKNMVGDALSQYAADQTDDNCSSSSRTSSTAGPASTLSPTAELHRL